MASCRKFLGAFVALFFLSSLPVTLAHADRIDDYIKSEMSIEHIPGLSLAIVKNGHIVKTRGYGLASVELNVPATSKTVYQIGSVSKQYTSALVMKLVELGKLKLDDPISKYLQNTPPTWKDITVRELMGHTSGIHEYAATSVGGPSDVNERLDYTDAKLLDIFKKLPLDFVPGTKWDYSDTGYVLLGMIITNATGTFYGDLLQEYIFKSLKMTSTRIISEADIIPNRAAGYWLDDNNALKNQQYVSPSLNRLADGEIYSTVLDMAKWDAALYSEKLLNKSDLVAMWTPLKLANGEIATTDHAGMHYQCGYGWFMGEINKHRVVEHSGWWQGFTSFFARYIDDKLTVVVLTNLAKAKTGNIAHHVAGLYEPALASANK